MPSDDAPEVSIAFTVHQHGWKFEVAEEELGIYLRYYERTGDRKDAEQRGEMCIPPTDADAIADAIKAVAAHMRESAK